MSHCGRSCLKREEQLPKQRLDRSNSVKVIHRFTIRSDPNLRSIPGKECIIALTWLHGSHKGVARDA